MHRRDFTGNLIAGGLALFATGIRGKDANRAALLMPIKNIPPGLDVDSLAKAYLDAFPQFADRSLLLRILRDTASRCESMSEAIGDDFERGATLRIGGWVCADMELKLCVLHSRKWI
jgi:hypothetical protein